jgi:hypothetical protein
VICPPSAGLTERDGLQFKHVAQHKKTFEGRLSPLGDHESGTWEVPWSGFVPRADLHGRSRFDSGVAGRYEMSVKRPRREVAIDVDHRLP